MLRAIEVLTIHTGHQYAVRPMVVAGAAGPGLLVSVTGAGPVVQAWDLGTGAPLWAAMEELPGYNDAVLVGLPDGRRILAVSTEDGVERWNALTGDPLEGLLDSSDWTIWGVDAVACPGGGTMLLGAGHNHAVYRWDLVSGELMGAPLRGHDTSVRAVKFIPVSGTDGVIVSGDDAGYLGRWDPATGALIGLPVKGHASMVNCISHLAMGDGRSLFASSDVGGGISRWDTITGKRVGDPLETGFDVHVLATACPSGIPLLLASGASGAIGAWHAHTGEVIDLPLSGVFISTLDQPDGTALVAVGTTQGEVVVYSVSE